MQSTFHDTTLFMEVIVLEHETGDISGRVP